MKILRYHNELALYDIKKIKKNNCNKKYYRKHITILKGSRSKLPQIWVKIFTISKYSGRGILRY